MKTPAHKLLIKESQIEILLDRLDRKLLDGDRIKLLPASSFAQIVPTSPLAPVESRSLSIWCSYRARYGIPTTELIDWLKLQIGDRHAIEIGSGNGDLAYHLGIQGTDNYCQHLPAVKSLYERSGLAITTPDREILKIGAIDAVISYEPQVVVASWVTQKYMDGEKGNEQSSLYGVDEVKLIGLVETYIHIGNTGSHDLKRALDLPHKVYRFPWIVSRSIQPQNNVIHVWSKD